MTNPARPDGPPSIYATCWSSESAPASAVLSRTGSHKAATTSRCWPGRTDGLAKLASDLADAAAAGTVAADGSHPARYPHLAVCEHRRAPGSWSATHRC